MMTFQAWIPPSGEVVEPPVHPLTTVDVIYSDGAFSGDDVKPLAKNLNWSGEGDGPKIIAYSVVEEYVEKREPREWWIKPTVNHPRIVEMEPDQPHAYTHVREVLPEAPLDLTKITTPFGLLDEVYGPGTQAALKAHGGPHEYYFMAEWKPVSWPHWGTDTTYRVAPSAAPAKPAPREVVAWAVVERDGTIRRPWNDADFDVAKGFADKWGGTVLKLTGYL